MIISRLDGGLGNQLFQYATARRLAATLDVPLKLDITTYATSPLRKYELDRYAIKAEIASNEEIAAFRSQVSVLRRGMQKVFPGLLRSGYWLERSYHFDPQVLRLADNTYLEGYWQSPKYFSDQAALIRQDLTLKSAPTGKNKDILKKIESDNSVILHIRRGDYVTNQTANQFHGVCSLDYYAAAMQYIIQKVQDPHFYIFSDDSQWTKDNLKMEYPATYVAHNDGDHGYEDLRLMLAGKYFIIANSTFSWWGAWLSDFDQKIVIAPAQWFKADPGKASDLIPADWMQL